MIAVARARFSKGSRRRPSGNTPPASGIEGVDQNDIFVALETNVLEAVVEQEDVGMEAAVSILRPTANRSAPMPTCAVPGAHEHLRFVAGVIDGGRFAARDDHRCGSVSRR